MKRSMLFEIIQSDCLEALREMPDASVDSIVTDPPYGLSRDPDIVEVLTKWIAGAKYEHTSAGFMGKTWDSFVPGPEYWRECHRVLKPGGYLLAFAGSRTYDLMCIAVRMGGFEIRDQLLWLYGSGFPKSHNVSKAIDKAAGAKRETVRSQPRASTSGTMAGSGETRPWIEQSRERGYHESAGPTPVTPDAKKWDGWGTALKPAHEPIVMARKPFRGTVAANVLEHGTGAINVDGCRVPHNEECRMMAPSQANIDSPSEKCMQAGRRTHVLELKPTGRFPANILHDGSEAVLGIFPMTSGDSAGRKPRSSGAVRGYDGGWGVQTFDAVRPDSGSAARYFYCAKASKRDRDEGLDGLRNVHPTVKPTELMRYLCRLVTPPDGLVLDPFCGSGSTGKAALLEGFRFVGIEREEEYARLAEARCEWAARQVGLTPKDPLEDLIAPAAKSEPEGPALNQQNLFND